MSNGFKVIDITFRNARSQSEIFKEMGEEEIEEGGVTIPVSKTPEQVINFYKNKIESTNNEKEKGIYETTIFFIEEYQRLNRLLTVMESNETKKDNEETDSTDTEVETDGD